MVEEGADVTLCCSEEPRLTPRHVTWMMMTPATEKQWTMLFSVNISKERESGKQSRHQAGRRLEISDNVILSFTATVESGGLYSCLLEKEDRKLKEWIVLLAVVKCWVALSVFISLMHTTLDYLFFFVWFSHLLVLPVTVWFVTVHYSKKITVHDTMCYLLNEIWFA